MAALHQTANSVHPAANETQDGHRVYDCSDSGLVSERGRGPSSVLPGLVAVGGTISKQQQLLHAVRGRAGMAHGGAATQATSSAPPQHRLCP